jgi:uncharacterized protein YdeI (YjbR/CyaY-like superfamily)
MKPIFFKNQNEFRKWLEANHEIATEVLVGYYKVKTGKPSLTWSESVDQALCFGWIDGIRRSIDDESYCIRFTPRRPNSNWSAVNIKKMKQLIKNGLMTPAGLAVYKKRKEDKSKVYGYENRPKTLPENLEKIFRKNKKAWKYFYAQAASYQKTVIHWIVSARMEKTRLARLDQAIQESSKGKRLGEKYRNKNGKKNTE